MQLENQVVSLEIAKKLKELGVKQDAYHSWCFIEAHNDYELDNGSCSNMYSAFTVAELGEMLPSLYVSGKTLEHKGKTEFVCCHKERIVENIDYQASGTTYGENEADARGKMLIYLLENNLIDSKRL